MRHHHHHHHHHGGLRHALRHDAGWIVAASHVLCALVGGGVLSLPHAVSWTGAVPGALCLALFFGVGVCSALLLVSARTTPRDGVRHATYYGAANAALGPRAAAAVAVFQNANNVLSATGYTIAAGQSARMVARALGGSPGPGFSAALSGVFGLTQVAMSQLPSLEEAWWSSALGALMSLAYAASAVALSAVTIGRRGKAEEQQQGMLVSPQDGGATMAAAGAAAAAADALMMASSAQEEEERRARALFFGRRAPSGALKAFGVFNALGALMFAFNFSSVQIEIHDTLHEPPDSDRAMRRATVSALTSAFLIYAAVAFAGHAALGDRAPGDVLTGFSSPRWLVAAANVFVLVHMFGAFQLFSQPVFQVAEAAVLARWPRLGAGGGGGVGGAGGGGASSSSAAAAAALGRDRRRRGDSYDDDRGTSSLIANNSSNGARGHNNSSSRSGAAGLPLPPSSLSPPRALVPGAGVYRPGGGGEIELGGAESWQAAAGAYSPYPPPAAAAFRLHSDDGDGDEGEEGRGGGGGGGGIGGGGGKRLGPPSRPQQQPLQPPPANGGVLNDDDGAASPDSPSSSAPSLPDDDAHTDRPPRAGRPLRLALRTLYVLAVTAAAVAFEESFEGVVGLGGAVVYWPQAVYVPTSIYLATRSPTRRVRAALAALNAAVGVVAALATLGAVHSLMSGLMAGGGREVGAGAPGPAGPWGGGSEGGSWPQVVYGPPESEAAAVGGGPGGRRRSLLQLLL